MTSKNDITGDSLKSKPASQEYLDNFDRIFRKEPSSISPVVFHGEEYENADSESKKFLDEILEKIPLWKEVWANQEKQ